MKSKTLLIVLGLLSALTQLKAQETVPIVSTEAMKMIEKDKKLVILDVRTPYEFNQGHIKGAINIDVSDPGAKEKYLNLDKSKKYLVICRTRNRSGVVTNFLVQNGFKNVYQITDGIVGWNANKLPLENN